MKAPIKGDKVKLNLGGHPVGPYTVSSIVQHKDGRGFASIKGQGRRFGVFVSFLKKVKT